MTRRVAILGGTFDPIHVAHISVLEQVAALLGADEARIVPLNSPPHRAAPEASAEQRIAMAERAVAGHAGMVVDPIEVDRGGPSYTIDSVTQWGADDSATEFHVVLGADAARLMPQWHRAPELLATGRFVVINRSGVGRVDVPEALALGFPQERTRLLTVVSPPISATEIRRRLGAGESVETMVDPSVLDLINEAGIYGVRPVPGTMR